MSPKRVVAVALLVAVAGCTGLGGSDTTTTVDETTVETTGTTDATTEPHTAVGTSHIDRHLSVRASYGAGNVTVTLAPDGDTETYVVEEGDRLSLTREIHDRGHGVPVVVERGGEVVFNATVEDYEYYEVVVDENDTRVSSAMV
ncbi:hypothetical protein [Halobacterium litoreum]|uniref:Uncharacterized protein n=1 Tax=Halobacterium litoreum TaxID=2039234 RepID=A0ABD5NHI6_9EURY|nr:hypothetical protein [Halobacterium litoreum]UHH12463.1 hypothetical protein LT972_09870 [Halobacterium litoreum]